MRHAGRNTLSADTPVIVPPQLGLKVDSNLDLDERYFAQHNFPNDISLAEYELATKRLDGDEKAFLWATNTISLLAPAIWFFGYRIHVDIQTNQLQSGTLPTVTTVTTVFIIFSIVFSTMAIIHVANLRKSRVISERKIVLLRRAMGVRYGKNSLILPSWRIEGADNPFALRLFPGLFSYSSFPIFLLSSFSGLSIALLFDNVPLGKFSPKVFELANPSISAIGVGCTWFLLSFHIFRLSLREQNENNYLWTGKLISYLFQIPLVENIEYKLYRCRLEVAEAARVHADVGLIEPFAILIEDKGFFRHKGISYRAMLRALWYYLRRGKRSGGSTITQQCARGNFIRKLTPAWRRKLVELVLARWLETVSSKEEILRIYLTTARFDNNVYGFHRAAHHFFPDSDRLEKAMAFILIERLGNIRSLFLGNRILELVKRLLSEGAIDRSDVARIASLYQSLIESGKIRNDNGPAPQEVFVAFLDEV